MDVDVEGLTIKAENVSIFAMMTLHGIPIHDDDNDELPETQKRNRRDWNRWVSTAMQPSEIEEVQNEMKEKGIKYNKEDFVPFSDEEFIEIRNKFGKRTKNNFNAKFPDQNDDYDLSDLYFINKLDFSGYLFRRQVNFSKSRFEDDVIFENAIFMEAINFNDAKFTNEAYLLKFKNVACKKTFEMARAEINASAILQNCIVGGYINFDESKFYSIKIEKSEFLSSFNIKRAASNKNVHILSSEFRGVSSFSGSDFGGATLFQRCICYEDCIFTGTRLSGKEHKISFEETTFKKRSSFLNTTFSGPTSFKEAIFEAHAPELHGANLHEGLVLWGVQWPKAGSPRLGPWPGRFQRGGDKDLSDRRRADAENNVAAFQRLKEAMEKAKRHEDELMFFALELSHQRIVDGAISSRGMANGLYALACNYGRSLFRPVMFLLLAIWVFGTLYWLLPLKSGERLSFRQALAHSSASVFAIAAIVGKDAVSVPTLASPAPRHGTWGVPLAQLKPHAVALSYIEALIGALQIFLVGLALRNRFRLK